MPQPLRSTLRLPSRLLLSALLVAAPLAAFAQPTELDEAYATNAADLLHTGLFTVCKVAPGSAVEFPFQVEAGGVVTDFSLVDSTAPPPELVNPLECVDAYVDPGTGSGAEQVTITELVPGGWDVTRIAIWSLERENDVKSITFHEAPAGTESITGSIDNGKEGCLALFYNDFDEGACWMTGGGVKFERVTGTDMATASMGNGPVDTVGGVVFPACSSEPSNGGQWNHVAHSDKLHIKGNDVHTVSCGNVPGIEEGSESPVTPFNYIEFEGTGEVRGIHGNKIAPIPVTFFGRVEDRNEPGNEQSATSGDDIDRYFLRVLDLNGNLVYLVDVDGDENTVDPITITGGNFQLHTSSCAN